MPGVWKLGSYRFRCLQIYPDGIGITKAKGLREALPWVVGPSYSTQNGPHPVGLERSKLLLLMTNSHQNVLHPA